MFENIIKEISHNNSWGCSVKEYSYIVDILTKYDDGCNFLVFGLGKDTKLWDMVNNKGKTVFLENLDVWIKKTKDELNVDVRKVEYTTIRKEWNSILDDKKRLYLPLDKDIIETKWDLIFIDSPMGGNDSVPGRMQSIYTASTLNCKDYILHDVDRVVEKTYGNKYLGTLVKTIDKLNHYQK